MDRQATTDGNAHFFGLELVNRGTGTDPWPETQLDAAVRWAAALCRRHGWTERSVIGHQEWQPGKIDPAFAMDDFRTWVRPRLHSHRVTTGHTLWGIARRYATESANLRRLNPWITDDLILPGQWVRYR
nr:N-acetylmuramoyl-L-alanine amidase [Streptomyces rimosus]